MWNGRVMKSIDAQLPVGNLRACWIDEDRLFIKMTQPASGGIAVSSHESNDSFIPIVMSSAPPSAHKRTRSPFAVVSKIPSADSLVTPKSISK